MILNILISLLSRNFVADKKLLIVFDNMGSSFSSKQHTAKIRIMEKKGKRLDYLRPRGQIILTMNRL